MKNIRYPFLFFFLFFAVSFSSFAQQNEVLDELLEEEKATFGNSVYVVLTASGMIEEDITPEDAAALISHKEWRVKPKSADDSITLGELSAIVMKAFKIKGGLFYSLFPGPRYSTREIAFRGFVRGRVSPYMDISGLEAVTIVRKAMEWKEVYR
jgi:hypothetical protein